VRHTCFKTIWHECHKNRAVKKHEIICAVRTLRLKIGGPQMKHVLCFFTILSFHRKHVISGVPVFSSKCPETTRLCLSALWWFFTLPCFQVYHEIVILHFACFLNNRMSWLIIANLFFCVDVCQSHCTRLAPCIHPSVSHVSCFHYIVTCSGYKSHDSCFACVCDFWQSCVLVLNHTLLHEIL
jgi:hypothetical protein